MIVNNWIVVLFCWIIFSGVIYLGNELGTIYIDNDWWFVVLTFPISIPILIIGIPVAFIIKIFSKIKFKNTIIFLDKKKKM